LEKEFAYFKQNNYKVVSLDRIITKLNNKEEIPDNWVALTIDDAYKSFYENGLKIFKKYNYPFTLLVYVKATDRNYGDFMNWDQIKDASNYGTIALHSYAHPHLTYLNKEEIYKDTKKAYEIFEEKMGFAPKYYAYPYGEYDKKVQNTIKQFGFKALLNQSNGSVTKNSDPLNIHRVALVGKINIKEKLKYKTFDVDWIKPAKFPQDNILKEVVAKVDKDIKQLKLYVTGEGWRDIKVKNGIIDEKLNIYLKRTRVRIVLSTDYYTISNKIIIKEKNNKERTDVK